MAINISKTNFMIFHTKGKKVNLNVTSVVFDSNEIGSTINLDLIFKLERIYDSLANDKLRTLKLLGVCLDEALTVSPSARLYVWRILVSSIPLFYDGNRYLRFLY